ncbi:MAG: biopolymer transporter ExbD [Myxococcales bacterium]|nr:biopolymer transporter ExbD [Myxococcales bacterium]
MIAARWPGYVALGIAGLALAIGLLAGGGASGDRDDGDALERYARTEARAHQARAGDVAIDLPPPPDEDDDDVLTVEVRDDGAVVAGTWYADDELRDLARARARADDTAEAMVRSSSDLPYARVVEVLDLLRGAGLARVTMQADPDDPP